MALVESYKKIRQATEDICKPLQTEDHVVQPIVDVSPPKWHLGHTTWFFETFILIPHSHGYKEFNPNYNFVFNSYYETIGARVIRTDRGNLSRPTVSEVYQYRKYIDEEMIKFMNTDLNDHIKAIITLGLNHEQQHQELLFTDIKFILGHNPLFPTYSDKDIETVQAAPVEGFVEMQAGMYDIGYNEKSFCFDNELNRHKVYLHDYKIANSLVTNGEFLEFINAGGYNNFKYWHSEGWDWVKSNQIKAPLYWHFTDNDWCNYTLTGLKPVKRDQPVCHISFYEATAFAHWKGSRLPTEFEWEAAASKFNWGARWEWTESAYLSYPGFKKAEGAIGEYNGKFMVNQMILRGASIATPEDHSRITYRNFFHPYLRWQFTGLRLAQ